MVWSNPRFFLQEYISRLSWSKSRSSCKYSCWDPSIRPTIIWRQQRCCYSCLQQYGATLISSLEQYLPAKSWNQWESITMNFLLCQCPASTLSTLCGSGARCANITYSLQRKCANKSYKTLATWTIATTAKGNMNLNPKTIFTPPATKF